MDVSSIAETRPGAHDDQKVYSQLWSLLARDPSSIHTLLNNDHIISEMDDFERCAKDKCVEKRLVCFSILDFKIRSTFTPRDSTKIMQAVVESFPLVSSDTTGIGACLRLLNSVLALPEGNHNAEVLFSEMHYIQQISQFEEHALALLDFLYLALTHPWISEKTSKLWFAELYISGVFWWLKKVLSNPIKLRFLQALFEESGRRLFHSHIEALQSYLRSQNLTEPLHFCSAYEFSNAFDPKNIGSHRAEALKSLEIHLKVPAEGRETELLKYYTQAPISLDTFCRNMSLSGPNLDGMWICPSRTMYIHALKTYIQEYGALQCGIRGFTQVVHSRFSLTNDGVVGESKYATTKFKVGVEPVTNACQVCIDLSDSIRKSPEWKNLVSKNLCFSSLDGTLCVTRIKEYHREDKYLKLSIDCPSPSDLQGFQIIKVLDHALNERVAAIEKLLEDTLDHEKLLKSTSIENLVKKHASSESLLICNVFPTIESIERALECEPQDGAQKEKKRRLGEIKNAVNLNMQSKSWTRHEAMQSCPKTQWTPEQIKCIIKALTNDISCVNGDVGTGKSTVLASIIDNMFLNGTYLGSLSGGTIVICDTDETCEKIINKLDVVPMHAIVHLSGKVEHLVEHKKREVRRLLKKVQEIADVLDIPGDHSSSITAAQSFHQFFLEPMLNEYRTRLSSNDEICDWPLLKISSVKQGDKDIRQCIFETSSLVADIFKYLSKWKPLYLCGDTSKTLVEACDILFVSKDRLREASIKGELELGRFENVIIGNAEYFQPFELWQGLSLNTSLQKLIFSGNFINVPPPYVLRQLIPAESAQVELKEIFDTNPEIRAIRFPHEFKPQPIPGLQRPLQIVKGPGKVEKNTSWEDAEFCCMLYAYFRLVGYSSSSITIISLSPYQKRAIEIELQHFLEAKVIQQIREGPQHINTLGENYSHRNDIVIVSVMGDQYDLCYLSRLAKKGLLIVGDSGEFLQIKTSDLNSSSKTTKKEKILEIRDTEQLWSQLKSSQLK